MLCVLEIANNHGGNLDRGIATIREFAPLIKEYPAFTFAVKFQYRDPSILHPALTTDQTERFRSTMLSPADRLCLVNEARAAGFMVGCTPFDEESVELMREHGFDFVKVASCSLTDWPLLERVVTLGLPTIASTAGASDEDVQRAAQFLARRVPSLVLMQCTAVYPTLKSDLRLRRIDELKRFGFPVGYSTHERPEATHGVYIAAAKGCQTFEWHVDLPPAANKYSLSVEDCRTRLGVIAEVLKACGTKSVDGESESLHKLRRGVYARRDLEPGEVLTAENTVLQLPAQVGQLVANDLGKYLSHVVDRAVAAGDPVKFGAHSHELDSRDVVQSLADKVLAVLRASGAVLPKPARLTLSHHKGLANFEAVGCGMVEVVNGGTHAKKLIVMLPGQRHPAHKHYKKDETFNVLRGDLNLVIENKDQGVLTAGVYATIPAGWWHAFNSNTGCVFEEVSTALLPNDSEYREQVDANRKTEIWVPA